MFTVVSISLPHRTSSPPSGTSSPPPGILHVRSNVDPATNSSQANKILKELVKERDSPNEDKDREDIVIHDQLDSVEPHSPITVEDTSDKARESVDTTPKTDISCKNGTPEDKFTSDEAGLTSSAKSDSDVASVPQKEAKIESSGMELNTGISDANVDIDAKLAEVSTIAESTVFTTVENTFIEGKEESQQSQEASEKKEGDKRDEEKAPVPPPRRKRKKKMNKQPSLENLVDVSVTERGRRERERGRRLCSYCRGATFRKECE